MGAQYVPATVLAGSSGELTEMKIDARLSGDYRPLVLLLNSLERDKMFFVINGVTLTGQQSGTVNLRLRLTTYLRGGMPARIRSDAIRLQRGGRAMNLGTGRKSREKMMAGILGVLALGACIYIYEEVFATSTPGAGRCTDCVVTTPAATVHPRRPRRTRLAAKTGGDDFCRA